MELNIEQIVAEMRQKMASRPGRDEYGFSESDYLDLYPDVRQAVAAGTYSSGYDHWNQIGRAEGRRAQIRRGRNAGQPTDVIGDKSGMQSTGKGARDPEEVRIRTVPTHLFEGIGEPAPLVNTARGRLSHALMRLMGKALWWYSFRLKQALESLVSTLNDSVRDMSRMGARLDAMQQGLREMAAQQDEFRKALEVLRRDSELLRRDSTAQMEKLQTGLSDVVKSTRDSGTVHIPNLANRIAALGLQTHQTRADLTVQERRLSVFIEEIRRSTPQSPESAPVEVSPQGQNGHTRLYLDFEAAFRGSREDIREHQSIYIPILREAGAGQHGRPVLDLGCGRGEWLELLRSENMAASGTDSNPCMVETCRNLGLSVEFADALSALRNLPESSVGAITAFHLVEHLPFEDLLALIDDSVRVLKPGGILILETPNPGNIQVGAQYFYLDPTHVRPLPSPMLRFFVEVRGMCRVEVLELHPYPDTMRVPDDGTELAKRFNDYFYGPRDYAVIGRRP